MRLLLLNTFDLAEDTISLENVNHWIAELNRTHPEQFASLGGRLETCDLEAELDTVGHDDTTQIIGNNRKTCAKY